MADPISSARQDAIAQLMQSFQRAKPITNEAYSKSIVSKATDAQEGAIHNMIRDTDNDGRVSAEESRAHAADVSAHRDLIDTDNDGSVSFQEELRYALDNQQVTKKEISVLLATDTNGDGVMSSAEKKAYAQRSGQKESIKQNIKQSVA